MLNDPEQIIIADSRYVNKISVVIPSRRRRDHDQSNAKDFGGENAVSVV